MPQDQRTLVLLAIAGSDTAFTELVRMKQDALVTLMTRVCGQRALAEDVAQAAFLKAWRKIRSLRDVERFDAWLRQIAFRAAFDALRVRVNTLPLDDAADVAEVSDDVALRLDLDAALQRLTVAQRACVLLAHGEGLSHEEIAAELGIPVGTVKSHVARGVRILRRVLEEESGA